MTPVGI